MSVIPMNLKRETAQKQRRAAALQHGMDVTIKLWEERDPKLANR